MRANSKPRCWSAYSARSSSHQRSTDATGCSSNCASNSGSTGSWATSTTASIARLKPATGSSTGSNSSSLTCSIIAAVSPLVGVDEDRVGVDYIAAGDPCDLDVAKALGLIEVDEALLEQLEDGEEADDHLEPLGEVGRQVAERDAADAGQLVDELGDRLCHREAHRVDVEQVDERFGARRQRPNRGALQTPHAGALEQVGGELGEALVGPDEAREREVGVVGEAVEHLGDVFERLALDQARQQQVALLPQGELVVEVAVVGAREQAARLELDQRGRDEHELGGDVEVEPLHALDLLEVAVDDDRQVDLVDVDLLLQDQLQEQVERPFVDRCRHIDRHWAPTLPGGNDRHVASGTS